MARIIVLARIDCTWNSSLANKAWLGCFISKKNHQSPVITNHLYHLCSLTKCGFDSSRSVNKYPAAEKVNNLCVFKSIFGSIVFKWKQLTERPSIVTWYFLIFTRWHLNHRSLFFCRPPFTAASTKFSFSTLVSFSPCVFFHLLLVRNRGEHRLFSSAEDFFLS